MPSIAPTAQFADDIWSLWRNQGAGAPSQAQAVLTHLGLVAEIPQDLGAATAARRKRLADHEPAPLQDAEMCSQGVHVHADGLGKLR